MKKICVLIFLPVLLLISNSVKSQGNLFGTDTTSLIGDTIDLVLDNSFRGNLTWQKSYDNENWTNIDTSFLIIERAVLLRAAITEGTCEPVYSDTARVLVNPDNLKSLAGGAFRTLFNQMYEYEGVSMAMEVMADHSTCSWGNSAMRDFSGEPRINSFNNDISYSYYRTILTNWENSYQAISTVNAVIQQMNAEEFNIDFKDDAPLVEAFCYFVSGLAHGWLGLTHDQATIINWDTNLSLIELKPWDQVVSASLEMLDQAIAICEANSFTVPESWVAGAGLDDNVMTSAELAQLANSYAARIMISQSRTKAHNEALNWSKVKAYADKGITSDFTVEVGDAFDFFDMSWVYLRYPGWGRVDHRIINQMDHNYPSRWLRDNDWPNGGPGEADAAQDARIATDFEYLSSNNFAPDRGYYHFSNYRFSRYDYLSDQAWYGIGSKPAFLAWEIDLIKAECEYRNGNETGSRAILNDVSKPRKLRGQCENVAASGAELLRLILDEKDIECFLTGAGVPFFDIRRTDRLQPGTLLHFPVPSTVLETNNIEWYTINALLDGIQASHKDNGWTGHDFCPMTRDEMISTWYGKENIDNIEEVDIAVTFAAGDFANGLVVEAADGIPGFQASLFSDWGESFKNGNGEEGNIKLSVNDKGSINIDYAYWGQTSPEQSDYWNWGRGYWDACDPSPNMVILFIMDTTVDQTSQGSSHVSEITLTRQGNTPVIFTHDVMNVTLTSASCEGNILFDGGAFISARGVCWSTSVNPTITDNFTEDGTGIGAVTSSLSDLIENTTYYVRAYATNSHGTFYGDEISFTTLSEEYTVFDIEGNLYTIVEIGNQKWMAENLRTSKYNDGTDIQLVTGSAHWANLSTPGYCFYNNDETTYKDTYGALYNWYTVNTGKLCPANWHVPTKDEWAELISYVGSEGHSAIEGDALKTTSGWKYDGNGTDNYGFSALPGGYKSSNSDFSGIGSYGVWWTSADGVSGSAWANNVEDTVRSVRSAEWEYKNGLSVRCIKDFCPITRDDLIGTWVGAETGDSNVDPLTVTFTAGPGSDQLLMEANAGVPQILSAVYTGWGETFQAGFGREGGIVLTVNGNGSLSIDYSYWGQTIPGPYDYWYWGIGSVDGCGDSPTMTFTFNMDWSGNESSPQSNRSSVVALTKQ